MEMISSAQDGVIVVDWSRGRVVTPTEVGYQERISTVSDIAKLREELAAAVANNEVRRAAGLVLELRAAGVPEQELEGVGQAVLFMANRKLDLIDAGLAEDEIEDGLIEDE
jgi:hypothetical protein